MLIEPNRSFCLSAAVDGGQIARGLARFFGLDKNKSNSDRLITASLATEIYLEND